MRHIQFLNDSRTIATFFKALADEGDKLVPLTEGDRFGHSYQRLNRMVENGKLEVYVLYGTRYAKASALEELEPPRRGRPPKRKKLSDDECGYVI
jgi:hypothetical protein